jgi:hypothetical protein
MPGNNGINITVYGSLSRSDNCDREFQRIPAKFRLKQEPVDFPSKSLAIDSKEDERVKKSKKKPTDLAPEASTVKTSTAGDKIVMEEKKTPESPQ